MEKCKHESADPAWKHGSMRYCPDCGRFVMLTTLYPMPAEKVS